MASRFVSWWIIGKKNAAGWEPRPNGPRNRRPPNRDSIVYRTTRRLSTPKSNYGGGRPRFSKKAIDVGGRALTLPKNPLTFNFSTKEKPLMTDSTVLRKALAKRKQLVRELNHLPAYQELVRLDAFVATYHELEGGGAASSSFAPEAQTTPPRVRLRESIPDAAFAILHDCSTPLPVGELVSVLEESGRPVGGKNRNINLSSLLSRDPRFENVSGRGWKLKSEAPNDAETDDAPPAATGEASNSAGLAGLPGRPLQATPGRFDSD